MPILKLTDVTMMEAVNALREKGLYLQLEREQLETENTDRSRPVVDSTRRFDLSLSLDQPVENILTSLTRDDGYAHMRLTDSPESYWIFPNSPGSDQLSRSVMQWKVEPLFTPQYSLAELVTHRLGLEEHHITVFDRGGFLAQVTPAPEVETAGRPIYAVLGDLFARSGKKITWTLGGIGDSRILAIGVVLP